MQISEHLKIRLINTPVRQPLDATIVVMKGQHPPVRNNHVDGDRLAIHVLGLNLRMRLDRGIINLWPWVGEAVCA